MKWSRVAALCRKESLQIVRDPSSILMAFVMPVVLIFIFGYGVNLDVSRSPVAVVARDDSPAANNLQAALRASTSLRVSEAESIDAADRLLAAGKVRGYLVIDATFGRQLAQSTVATPAQGGGSLPAQGATPSLLIVTDGSLPNIAATVAGNLQGVASAWHAQWLGEKTGSAAAPPLRVEARSWFNPSTESRNFLIPGSIVIIMTVLGALLTSLVVAREWERGTMESLLAAHVTRGELLLSKLIPYYVLAIIGMVICVLAATLVMGVPFRGSLLVLLLVTTLFLGGTLGLGLLISTKTRNQFNAAQAALNIAYMPAVMLSGFVYEIASMPKIIQWVANLLPARYFVSAVQTLFQAGTVWRALLPDIAFLAVTAAVFLGITYAKTRETLE
jgi:ABC-2 type transport system permease protein